MVHRSRAAAEPWRVPNSARDVFLRERNRLVQRTADGQVRRQRGGEGTAGSMCMPPGDSVDRVASEHVAVIDKIDDAIFGRVSSGDHDIDRPERQDAPRRFPAIFGDCSPSVQSGWPWWTRACHPMARLCHATGLKAIP